MNGRWLKVFFIITMQFPLGIQPALRTNVDYVFILTGYGTAGANNDYYIAKNRF